MSKIHNFYVKETDSKGVDKTWYDSSNIKYSECYDTAGELKTLKIVFANGTSYQYEGVNVNDYLLFREAQSQGQTLNRIIKKKGYEYKKLDNVDIEELNELMKFSSEGGYHISNKEKFTIKNNIEEVLYQRDEPLPDDVFQMIKDILKVMEINVKEM